VDNRALVTRLKERDALAMAEVYGRFGGLLYSLVLRCVSSPASAEDLVQEILLRIWNRIHTFDEANGSFEGWITAIARNHAIDHLRSRRNSWIECRGTALSSVQNYPLFFNYANEARRVDSRIAVGGALATLNQSQREVLEMTYFEGLTQAEIANQLNKPLGTVKSLVRSSLKVLRTSLVPLQPV